MNSPQAKLQRARDAEASEAPDLKKFKTDLLGKVIVKTIVKQQVNDRRVSALEFNRLPGGTCGNLFATLAGDFATVYDDEHFGDHVAVVAQFKNDKTAHVAGGDLDAVAWLDGSRHAKHELGDALLALGGGDDHAIQVMSVAEGRIVTLMRGGHAKTILALGAGQAVGSDPDASAAILVSLGADGVARTWDWRQGADLGAVSCPDAVSLAVTPDAAFAFIGRADGALFAWPLPKAPSEKETSSAGAISKPFPADRLAEVAKLPAAAECLRALPGDRLAAKCVDGFVRVFSIQKEKGEKVVLTVVREWRAAGQARPPRSALLRGGFSHAFGCDEAGDFLALGNAEGEFVCYDVQSGEAIKTIDQDRDFKALNGVTAAGVSNDCRHVYACFGPGIVWRAEVVPGIEDDEEAPRTPPEEK